MARVYIPFLSRLTRVVYNTHTYTQSSVIKSRMGAQAFTLSLSVSHTHTRQLINRSRALSSNLFIFFRYEEVNCTCDYQNVCLVFKYNISSFSILWILIFFFP